MKNVLIMTLAVALVAMSAKADTTYSPTLMGNAFDASGNPIVDGTALMIVDLDGDGCNGISYLAAQPAGVATDASWLWDADDMILDRAAISYGEGYPFKMLTPAETPASFTPNVDQYYVLWFDAAFNVDATGPGANVAYGAELLGVVGPDGKDFTPDANGGVANLTTVPEPATMTVLLAGCGLAALRRFRARRAA